MYMEDSIRYNRELEMNMVPSCKNQENAHMLRNDVHNNV
jgi:hypothetical protein